MTRALAEKVAAEIGKEWMFSEKDIKRVADIIERAGGQDADRWQKAIYEACRNFYPDVDGTGCDSGDPLDVSVSQIKETCCYLQGIIEERNYSLRAGGETAWASVAELIDLAESQGFDAVHVNELRKLLPSPPTAEEKNGKS